MRIFSILRFAKLLIFAVTVLISSLVFSQNIPSRGIGKKELVIKYCPYLQNDPLFLNKPRYPFSHHIKTFPDGEIILPICYQLSGLEPPKMGLFGPESPKRFSIEFFDRRYCEDSKACNPNLGYFPPKKYMLDVKHSPPYPFPDPIVPPLK